MSDFQGFRPRAKLESFTGIPNEFFDEVMANLNGNEIKILLTIFRKTYGWVIGSDKKGNPIYKREDSISLSQFKKLTGIKSINTIKKYLKKLTAKGYIIQTQKHDCKENKAAQYALKMRGDPLYQNLTEGGDTPVSKFDRGPVSKFDSTKESNKEIKTEEEEAIKIPQKIKQRFFQIFDRNLTVEFYQKIIEYYSDEKIILKVLELAEENAKVPKYILDILKDWSKNNLTSLSMIEEYLDNRQAQKQYRKSRKKTAATKQETSEEELNRMYQQGWK